MTTQAEKANGSEALATTARENDPTLLDQILAETERRRYALEPSSLAEARQLATEFARSGIFGVATKAEHLLAKIMTGRELKLTAMTAMRVVYVFEAQGKLVIGLDAALIAAIIQRLPHVEYCECVETDDKHATWEIKKRGRPPMRHTYTIEMAKRAGLTDKNTWKAHPEAMLRARCVSAAGRMWEPGAIMGIYTVEEAMEFAASWHFADDEAAPRPSASPVTTDDWRARIAACADVASLQALAAEIAKLPADARAALRDVYAARKRALTPRDDGPRGGAPPPSAPEHVDATGDREPGADDAEDGTVARWRDHMATLESPQHVAASHYAHLSEVPSALRGACTAATLARLAAFRSVVDPVTFLNTVRARAA